MFLENIKIPYCRTAHKHEKEKKNPGKRVGESANIAKVSKSFVLNNWVWYFSHQVAAVVDVINSYNKCKCSPNVLQTFNLFKDWKTNK